ncbi:MAG: hypothetical protein J2P55_02265 [Rhizobiales bacterium]|nr:hypothetical protein [Hyphomicrobiales bacterium]
MSAFVSIPQEPPPASHAVGLVDEYVFPQSYSFYIREGFLARLKALPMFGKVAKWARTKFFIKQHDVFPFVGVYLMGDTIAADGDPNHGAPHYLNLLRLGFSVVVADNDPDVLDQMLDQAYWAIMNLMTIECWQQFQPPTPGAPLIEIEAMTRGSRENWYGNAPLNNDSPIGELRCDLTFSYRVILKPVVTDDLKLIHEEVVRSWPYDPNERDDVIVEYDFTQSDFLPTDTPTSTRSPHESESKGRSARQNPAPPKRSAIWR